METLGVNDPTAADESNNRLFIGMVLDDVGCKDGCTCPPDVVQGKRLAVFRILKATNPATHLLEGVTTSEPSRHKDVKTTMICTHVLNRGPSGAWSPVDGL